MCVLYGSAQTALATRNDRSEIGSEFGHVSFDMMAHRAVCKKKILVYDAKLKKKCGFLIFVHSFNMVYMFIWYFSMYASV